jgi:hypothetical protein
MTILLTAETETPQDPGTFPTNNNPSTTAVPSNISRQTNADDTDDDASRREDYTDDDNNAVAIDKSAIEHHLESVPAEFVSSLPKYSQRKCCICSRKVRTSCRCSPEITRCVDCYAIIVSRWIVGDDSKTNDTFFLKESLELPPVYLLPQMTSQYSSKRLLRNMYRFVIKTSSGVFVLLQQSDY